MPCADSADDAGLPAGRAAAASTCAAAGCPATDKEAAMLLSQRQPRPDLTSQEPTRPAAAPDLATVRAFLEKLRRAALPGPGRRTSAPQTLRCAIALWRAHAHEPVAGGE
jgi:hypothetical protein